MARVAGKPGGVDTDTLRKTAREALTLAGIHPKEECGGRFVDRLKWFELESVIRTGRLPAGHVERIRQEAQGTQISTTPPEVAARIVGRAIAEQIKHEEAGQAMATIGSTAGNGVGAVAKGSRVSVTRDAELIASPLVDVKEGNVISTFRMPHTLNAEDLYTEYMGNESEITRLYHLQIEGKRQHLQSLAPKAPDISDYPDLNLFMAAMVAHTQNLTAATGQIEGAQKDIALLEEQREKAFELFGEGKKRLEERAEAQRAEEERAREEAQRASDLKRQEKELEKARENLLPGMRLAAVDSSFVLSASDLALFNGLIGIAASSPKHHAPNVLNVGPAGCGKTEKAVQFAAFAKLPYVIIDCHLVREARDFFGAKGAMNGSIVWNKSLFCQAVAKGNCVIVLNELNRAVPMVLNALLSLLDDMRSAYIEESGELLEVGPRCFFFATANIGSEYTGTAGAIDTAIDSRFGVQLESSFLAQKDEAALLTKRCGTPKDKADKLAYIAAQIRSEYAKPAGRITRVVSTRTMLYTAQMYAAMGNAALTFSILNKFEQGEERQFVAQLIQAQGML